MLWRPSVTTGLDLSTQGRGAMRAGTMSNGPRYEPRLPCCPITTGWSSTGLRKRIPERDEASTFATKKIARGPDGDAASRLSGVVAGVNPSSDSGGVCPGLDAVTSGQTASSTAQSNTALPLRRPASIRAARPSSVRGPAPQHPSLPLATFASPARLTMSARRSGRTGQSGTRARPTIKLSRLQDPRHARQAS